jgi:hypothetical protein
MGIPDGWARAILITLAGIAAMATGCISGPGDLTARPADLKAATFVLPPETVRERTTVPVMGFVLEPLAEGYVPEISWEEALELAEAEEDTSDASEIRSVLALFTDPGEVPVTNELVEEPAVIGPPLTVKVPAWLITIDGVCVPSYGPTSRGEWCASTKATVVINADSGDVMMEYSFE